MKLKIALFMGALFALQLFSNQLLAQNVQVTGKVTARATNLGLDGASVSVKGTSTGVVTDQDGNYSISVASGSIIVASYAGMADLERTATASGTIDFVLDAIAGNLDEVIVVGYGTQRKSNITGAISSVKASDLQNVPNGRIEQALQGRVAGVTIMQNSGQPGSASTIRVRGITTFNNNNPLWVVDGVVVDAGGIGYLNQSDIESIEVLKDAASAAIYGTRAATGVILVTTKKGKSGKLSVSYNGFYGTSSAARKLSLLNATEYATLLNERSLADGGNVLFADPASLGKGTDWQEAIFNNSAGRYLHEVSVSGGSERSTIYFSAGMQEQDGIVSTDISNYKKINLRLNTTFKISDIFSAGQTLGYTRQKSAGLGNTNSEFGGPLSSAINLDPITKLVITDPAVANGNPYSNNPVVRDANGNPYGISSLVGQEMTNPLAYIYPRLGGYNWSDDFVGNVFLEAAPIKGLKVRSTLGFKKAYWGNYGFTPVHYLSATNQVDRNRLSKGENNVFNWNIENTITYNKRVKDHDFTVLVGQGAYVENIGGSMGVTYYDLPVNNYQDATFRFDIPIADRETWASTGIEHKISSIFGRLNYSYQDKYLFTGIIRRDGSTRFGGNNKYGVFPSFSAGWNVHRESFWTTNNIINSLKIRGGYGVVGNDAIADFGYLSLVVGGYNYTLGDNEDVTIGYAPRTLDNPDLKWEQTASTDFGFDAQLFQNFNLSASYYNKKTTGILRPVVIPGYVGVGADPSGNVADMKNSGIEIEFGYRKQFGELGFGINGNFSTLKNVVTYVASDTNFIGGGAGFQSMGNITRVQVGQPYNAFFGYRTLGIFQNQAQIQDHKNSGGTPLQPNAKPGDFIWADLDGDGTISSGDLDRTFLGSNIPKYTYGFTINLDYKGFDLMAFAQGAGGNKIFQGLRRLDIGNANYSNRALSRWTHEGQNTSHPRMTLSDPNANYSRMSDFYLEDGDYLRLKVLQLGYTLPRSFHQKAGISRIRFYVTAENLFTITKYTGYDPEVGGGIFGVDRGQYPQARAIMGGLQLQF